MKKTILISALLLAFGSMSYGQELVKDIWPGTKKSDILKIYTPESINSNIVYVVTNDSTHGYELWRTGGTAATTYMIKDINPGIGNAFSTWNQVEMASIGTSAFFAADDGNNGFELWKSNGTAIGTGMVKDIKTGSSGSFPRSFITYKNEVYFSAQGPEGYELWKTDGTSSGTVLLKDIITPFGSEPKDLTIFKGELYFVIKDRNNNSYYELWKTDGSTIGTVRVSDSTLNLQSIQSPTVAGNNLFFSGTTVNEGVELWASDGTKAGTRLVKELNIPNQGPRLMIDFKGKLFFSIYDNTGYKAIYESDGTAAGTKLMINFPDGIYSDFFKVFKDKFYFMARHNATKYDIWASNGTNDGTKKVTDLDGMQAFLPNTLFPSNNRLFFRAQNKADGNNAYELYVTDGTQNGTRLTKNINTIPNGSAQIWHMTEVGNTIYFAAQDSAHGEELWKLETSSYKTLSLAHCDTVVYYDSSYTLTGTYQYTLVNSRGYDSLVTINVQTAPVPQITYADGIFSSTQAFQYQWQKDGVDIPNATSQTFTPTANGVYGVRTIDLVKKQSCPKFSETFALNNVSVSDVSIQYAVYPNPAQRAIKIRSQKQVAAVTIFTATGSQVLKANHAQVNVEGLSNGLYILQVQFMDGTQGNTQLVISN